MPVSPEAARAFAIAAHAGQTDRLGHPYAAHVLHVGESVARFGPEAEAVGYLHDVIEDCGVAGDQICARFGAPVQAAVLALSRGEGEAYFGSYLPRVLANPVARLVKTADARHNLGKGHLLEDPRQRNSLRRRYIRALDLLAAADPACAGWGPVPDLVFRDGAWRAAPAG